MVCRRPLRDIVLQVRVGIATGLVVSEGAGNSGWEEVTVGKPLHLADRLQALTQPGTVVIAEGTRRLVGELFALGEFGPPSSQGVQLTCAGLVGARRGHGREPLRGAARGKSRVPDRPPAGAGARCSTAGSRPRRARVNWSCSLARQGSASPGWSGRYARNLVGNRTQS